MKVRPSGRIYESVLLFRHSGTTAARTRALSSSTQSPPLMDILLQIEKDQLIAQQAHQRLPGSHFCSWKNAKQIAAILDDIAHHINSSIQHTAETTSFSHKNNAGSAILAT
eukprot:scaffold21548_cov32-Attheya_sp.AAC.1